MQRISFSAAALLAAGLAGAGTAAPAAAQELTGTYIAYGGMGANGTLINSLNHSMQFSESGLAPFSCDAFYPGAPVEEFAVEGTVDGVGFTAELGLKDGNLILAAADQARVPMPTANAWRDRLLGAIAHGDGQRDWAVMALEQARASGLE